MIDIIDNFFKWLKSATFVSDLIIRFVVVVIIGWLSIIGWFISIPIFAWYFYIKFGNARISGCRCYVCNMLNDCNDKFCINCGSPLYSDSQKQKIYQTNSNDNYECRCNKCDTKNSCDNMFCINCGNKLDNIHSQLYVEITNSIDGIIVALLSKIAKADGRISQEEADYLSSVFNTFAEKRGDRFQAKKIYKEILKQEKNKINNIDEYCNKLSYANPPKELKIEIVKIFMELAYIDGVYDKNEENIIVPLVPTLRVGMHSNIKTR